MERPRILESVTEEVNTGCGHLYVTIGWENGKHSPVEVRAVLGKAGGCSNCFLESLNRAISVGLQFGIPAQEFVRELKGHQCPGRNLWPKEEETLSCPDGIAQILDKYTKSI